VGDGGGVVSVGEGGGLVSVGDGEGVGVGVGLVELGGGGDDDGDAGGFDEPVPAGLERPSSVGSTGLAAPALGARLGPSTPCDDPRSSGCGAAMVATTSCGAPSNASVNPR